jgi:TetR/AcrR family transcriptional repressor of nem operon
VGFSCRKLLLYDRKHFIEHDPEKWYRVSEKIVLKQKSGLPMRYSSEHKQETHARIVKKASVRLREKGAHGIGVADLMKEAGLTHGGFYAHFDSREALVIEAFAYAMDRSTERWRKIAEQTPPDKRLAMIVDSYLTSVHRDDPGHGCAVPSLGAEIARESPKTRKAFAAKLEKMIDMVADQIPDLPRKVARKEAAAALATMMGTLVLARIAGNGDFSDEILASGREAVLGRVLQAKQAAKKPASKKAAKAGTPARQ